MRLPTRLDRYPAKMVSQLADRLVEHYASNASRLFDPFCGSGAVLTAAHRRGIPASGVDLNPIAALFSSVKLNGFSPDRADQLANELIRAARKTKQPLPIQWSAKHYWFTPITLEKYERLRSAGKRLNLKVDDDGIAVLLSIALSIRLCSRADQRSPKPFISKQAKEARKGRHFDPYRTLLSVLHDLTKLYGHPSPNANSRFLLADVASDPSIPNRIGKHSHVITSPPYINAQDYFRNFKLELYLLEDMLPFRVDDLWDRFIGTERGDLLAGISDDMLDNNYRALSSLRALKHREPRLEAVVHRYLYDMGRAFDTIKDCLEPNALFVLVCGDNLIGGIRIRTWQLLKQMLEERGFKLFDRFSDPIENRMLAPKRCGHKGLIKEEVVCAFQMQ